MMQRYLYILFLMLAFTVDAEVHYFTSDSIKVPGGEITAVEVRAANHSSRVGDAKLAGWRILWPGVEISLSFDNRNFIDGVSQIFATLKCNDETSLIKKGINVSGQFNSISIEWRNNGAASILCGEHKIKEVLNLTLPKPTDFIRVEGFGGDVVIQDFIVETNTNSFERLKKYEPERITSAQKWKYLDRTNDPKYAIVGGSYVLAQIGNDLVYISGAKTNASHWKTGMLKGTLTPTGFEGYYKLQWYDATGRKMPGENFAEHDTISGVLKLSFPELGASIRLKLADEK